MSALTTPDIETDAILEKVAHELQISETEALTEGLRTLLQRHLRVIQSRVFQIRGQYGVTSVEDMEERYRQGTLDEAESWRDLQALDHLEYKQQRLQEMLDLLP
mgnify:CR=1 FL=1